MRRALATAIISGVAVFVNGYGVQRFPDATVYTTAKNVVAAALLAVLLVGVQRARGDAWTPPRSGRDAGTMLLIGVIGGGLPFVLFFEGLARASTVDAAFIHKTLVVWVVLLAVPLLRERPGPLQVAAIGALVGGQALMTGDLTAFRFGRGETMILLATLCWAVEVVVVKRALAGYSPATLGTARMTVGVAVLVVWLAAQGELGAVLRLDAEAWWWALGTGLLLAAYVATWYAALAHARAIDVSAVLVAGAIVTALLDAVVEGTSLRPDAVALVLLAVGTALAVAGARPTPTVRPVRAPAGAT